MQIPLPHRASQWVAVSMIIPLLVISCLVSGVFTWSPLNCWHEDVDINSGRVRKTWYLLYVCVSDQTEDSSVSRAIAKPLGPSDWRRVVTFSPGVRNSPNYAFHGATAQMHELELMNGLVPFDTSAKAQAANELLQRWHRGNSDSEAAGYLRDLEDRVMLLAERHATQVTLVDLP